MRTRIVLADDHALVRQGFRALLAAIADFEVVDEAANGREALRLIAEGRSTREIAHRLKLSVKAGRDYALPLIGRPRPAPATARLCAKSGSRAGAWQT